MVRQDQAVLVAQVVAVREVLAVVVQAVVIHLVVHVHDRVQALVPAGEKKRQEVSHVDVQHYCL